MRTDWRWMVATKLRYFGWWILHAACKVSGGHTLLDRLQQQCFVCAHNIMWDGKRAWYIRAQDSLARMKSIGTQRDRPGKMEWPALNTNLGEIQ